MFSSSERKEKEYHLEQAAQLFYKRHQIYSICFASLACCLILENLPQTSFLKSDMLTGIEMGLVLIIVMVSLLAIIPTNDIRKVFQERLELKNNDPQLQESQIASCKKFRTAMIITICGLSFTVAGGSVFTASFISKSSALTFTASALFAAAILLIGGARILTRYQHHKDQEAKRSKDQANSGKEISKKQLALEGIFFFMLFLCALALCDQGLIKLLSSHAHINSSVLTYLTISFLSAGFIGAIGIIGRRAQDKEKVQFSTRSKRVVAGGGMLGLLIGGPSGYLIGNSGVMAHQHQDFFMAFCGAIFFGFIGAVISGECYALKKNSKAVKQENDAENSNANSKEELNFKL